MDIFCHCGGFYLRQQFLFLQDLDRVPSDLSHLLRIHPERGTASNGLPKCAVLTCQGFKGTRYNGMLFYHACLMACHTRAADVCTF